MKGFIYRGSTLRDLCKPFFGGSTLRSITGKDYRDTGKDNGNYYNGVI